MKLHKHTPEECKTVFKSVRDLVKQIDRIEDKPTRHQVCEAAIEMCDRLIRDGKEM